MPRIALIMSAVFTVGFLSLGGAQAHHSSCTALHEAAFLDEPDEIKGLLAHGAELECRDVLGHTPLITAVNGGSLDSFTVLLSAGARTNVRTEFGQTLLQHTKEKYASFTNPNAQGFRDLYAQMVGRLQTAGAVN
ncbi:ankyrin repeat domain-containing protein [Pseudomonadota bacterium]